MIEYDAVSKEFGSGREAVTALRDVTFTVEAGNVVVLLGPSGCGKTTTLRLTNRLESLTRGSICVHGRDISDIHPVKLRQSMGYVIQAIGLFPNKTIAQNIAVVPELLGWDRRKIDDRVNELFRMVNLDAGTFWDRYPAELSGGQQQRIGVARGLAADPDILLMDEPFGAIDPINREQIQNEFLRLQARLKKTVLFVSHDIHEAIKMGDKIALFREGELVQYDTPEGILAQPASDFVADFVGSDRTLKVLGLRRVRDAVNREPGNVVHADQSAQEVLSFLRDKDFSFAVVVDDDRPVGYVTRKRLKQQPEAVRQQAHALPACIEERNPLHDALSTMLMHDIMVLCVVDDDGRFSGTVSYQDIQNETLNIYAEESDDGGTASA